MIFLGGFLPASQVTLGNLAIDQFFSFYLKPDNVHYGWLNSAYLWPPVSGGGIFGQGNVGEVTFWTKKDTTIGGSPDLLWDNEAKILYLAIPPEYSFSNTVAVLGKSFVILKDPTNDVLGNFIFKQEGDSFVFQQDGPHLYLGNCLSLNSEGKTRLYDLAEIKGVAYSFPSSQGSSNTYLKNDGAGNLTWSAVSGGMQIHGNEYHSPKFADSTRLKVHLDSAAYWLDSCKVKTDTTRFKCDSTRLKVHLDSATYWLDSCKVKTDTTRFKRDSTRLKVHLDSAAYWLDSCKVKVDTTRFKRDSTSLKAHRDSIVAHGATATPTANRIPIAGGSGKLDSWVSLHSHYWEEKTDWDGSNNIWTLTFNPLDAKSLTAFLISGDQTKIQRLGTDYTYETGQIIFTNPPQAGDITIASYAY